MKLYLINPCNPLVSIVQSREDAGKKVHSVVSGGSSVKSRLETPDLDGGVQTVWNHYFQGDTI